MASSSVTSPPTAPSSEPAGNDTVQKPPLSLRAYRAASRAAGPIAQFALKQRLVRGKEDPNRIDERRGLASKERPNSPLVWIHGASVGESLSILPLVERLLEMRPELFFLVTTGTTTSAKLMAERLPDRAFHQFAPVDHPDYVEKFITHWSPDAAIFIESEFWPNLILSARARIPFMALVNGRVSPKSFDAWRRRRDTIRYLLSAFDVLVAQDRKNAERLTLLSGIEAATFGNLKNSAPPLPGAADEIALLKSNIADRPVWLAASTHPGEEETIVNTHRLLKTEFPTLLTRSRPTPS